MAHYEIVAHVTRELPCDTAEEAAAIFRRQLLTNAGRDDGLLHLAVWRQDGADQSSPLPPALRQQLVDFFAGLERCAGEAEAAFRGRVESILMRMPKSEVDVDAGGPNKRSQLN
jgi:hypothetical protein